MFPGGVILVLESTHRHPIKTIANDVPNHAPVVKSGGLSISDHPNVLEPVVS